MGNPPTIQGRLIFRNTGLNLVGQVIPFPVGLVVIPYLVRGLGVEGFGILSFAWVLLGYFGLFDLGLGRATIKFVSESLGRNEMEQLPGLVWTSLAVQLVLATGLGALAAAFVPLIVERVLHMPVSLIGEARTSFFILAFSFPVVFGSNTLRGVLEAGQRFDLVNVVKVPASISMFVLPAAALAVGWRLPGMVVLMVLARLASMGAYLWVCFRTFPVLRQRFQLAPGMLRRLMSYGGWISVSHFVGPLLIYWDRFFIGARLSVAAVGYYTAPYDMVTRLLILPTSLSSALFPAFSSMGAGGVEQGRLGQVYARSLKLILLTMSPLMAMVMVFSPHLLRLWLGPDFAEESTLVLQILCVGVLINALSTISFSLVQALGRPDLTAKFHVIELPFYAVALWFLVDANGIAGAALASTLRMLLDLVLLTAAACRLRFVMLKTLSESGLLRTTVWSVALISALFVVTFAGGTMMSQVLFSALLLVAFALAAWRIVLDRWDKDFMAGLASRLHGVWSSGK